MINDDHRQNVGSSSLSRYLTPTFPFVVSPLFLFDYKLLEVTQMVSVYTGRKIERNVFLKKS